MTRPENRRAPSRDRPNSTSPAAVTTAHDTSGKTTAMTGSRMDALLAMRDRSPADSRILFALATEYEKLEQWDDVISVLREYLDATDDQGNAWGRLANAFIALDRTDEARAALTNGVEAATRHGHPSMAAEFEELLEDL